MIFFSKQARDGKTRSMKADGVLLKLTKELIATAKQEGGYPDSDDSGLS